MRSSILTFVFIMICCVAPAGETDARTQLCDGIYSIEVPPGWKLTEAGPYRAAVLHDAPESSCALVFAPPNPAVNANQLAAMEMVSLSMTLGGHRIVEAKLDEFKGYARMLVHFAAPLEDDNALVGLMQLIDVDGHVALATATAPDEKFDDFIAVALRVMESYEVDEDAMRAASPELREIGLRLKEDTIRELAGGGDKEAENKRRIFDEAVREVMENELPQTE